MEQLITGEITNHPDRSLINEYNQIHQEFNKNGLLHYSLDEVIRMRRRLMELRNVLVVEQLSLF